MFLAKTFVGTYFFGPETFRCAEGFLEPGSPHKPRFPFGGTTPIEMHHAEAEDYTTLNDTSSPGRVDAIVFVQGWSVARVGGRRYFRERNLASCLPRSPLVRRFLPR